ncbi:iron-containing alcohol dehydrogenase [Maridesulfovibrio salexigens]|uniref:Iron-containing alcohol dehydrogenase n=1 Tax=Maridesulfovibrio salexigens (strain ATCC 14822 / DSM 2638 / NCIMB 8403 / VKM B-1763) TaxID=526222 RepID=C6BWP7_MARSD|nr:iron-containing alcohol dehydrogenase [Maridesulfovibrio salexigens]ACS80327.1 iron-containing alcohol dehydrogenase [Maridesulfovibrio salexigens DSM 2638]
MLNFSFYNPTNIVFGEGQLQELDNLVPKDAKVLITYGGGSAKKTGLLDRVNAELAKSGRTVVEFGGIPANPKFEVLMDAIKIVRDEQIDFILAVGGGSVIDGTKFIALAAPAKAYEGREKELMHFGFTPVPVDSAVPFGTVLTLPATGSEMNNGAVISDGEDKLPVFSTHTFPKFSILDPKITFTLPKTQVANGVVDTFIHTIEQYLTYPVEGRFQDRTAEGILQTLIEIGETTVNEPENYDARANLVWCSTMALNGLIGAGVPQDWTTHMIGHELTALTGLDHAKTLAVMQLANWKVRRTEKREKLIQYAERVWDIREGDDDARIDQAIAKTEEFFNCIGMATRLSDYEIGPDIVDRVVAGLEKHGMTKLSERGDVTPEISRKMLETAL